MKIRRPIIVCIISIVLLLLVMGFIFYMSSQVADTSSKTSGGFIRAILKIFYTDFDSLSNVKQASIIESLQNLVRKLAHFSIYTLLGILSCNVVYCFTNKYKILLPISFAIGVLYSISDEIHQLFVKGRSGEFRDVCIDSSGVLLGLLIVFIVIYISNKIKSKKNRTR